MRRGRLIGVGVLLLLCVGVGAHFWFIALPAVRDSIREGIEHDVGTEVARRLPATLGAGVVPGVYRITAEQLRESLRVNTRANGGTPASGADNDSVVRLTPAGVEIGVTSRGQDAVYRSRLAAADGRLLLPDMTVDNDIFALFLPPADLARAIADGVNRHLATNDLRLESVSPTDGAVTLTTVPAP